MVEGKLHKSLEPSTKPLYGTLCFAFELDVVGKDVVLPLQSLSLKTCFVY